MSATRFEPEVNQLRAALRGRQGDDLLDTLHRQIELIPVAVLVADNSSHYVAANAAACALTGYERPELILLTVTDVTPLPKTDAGRKLWETFIAQGGQRGAYTLRTRSGSAPEVHYWAYASVAPGLHVSLLVPASDASPVPARS